MKEKLIRPVRGGYEFPGFRIRINRGFVIIHKTTFNFILSKLRECCGYDGFNEYDIEDEIDYIFKVFNHDDDI